MSLFSGSLLYTCNIHAVTAVWCLFCPLFVTHMVLVLCVIVVSAWWMILSFHYKEVLAYHLAIKSLFHQFLCPKFNNFPCWFFVFPTLLSYSVLPFNLVFVLSQKIHCWGNKKEDLGAPLDWPNCDLGWRWESFIDDDSPDVDAFDACKRCNVL